MESLGDGRGGFCDKKRLRIGMCTLDVGNLLPALVLKELG